jgi:2-phosphosulfolactate phosphatase
MSRPASTPPCQSIASVEVLLTPADFATLPARDLCDTTCVVFDVLRATTSMISALAAGAQAIIPVEEISEALALRARHPDLLLAGERNGLRIGAAQTGGIDFDFGNSPREFTADRVRGRTLAATTTNGTRALRACAGARLTLVGSLLNLSATADWITRQPPPSLVLVCSGTFDQAAYEDLLAVGALLELLSARFVFTRSADTVHIARQVWQRAAGNLLEAVRPARNASKLLGIAELAADVPFSLQRDTVPLVAAMSKAGQVRVLS